MLPDSETEGFHCQVIPLLLPVKPFKTLLFNKKHQHSNMGKTTCNGAYAPTCARKQAVTSET